MLAIEEILYELQRDEVNESLPPGFRFHPTDEELITFYLASKVFDGNFSCGGVQIAEVDLNRCEPWELPDMAKMGEREWYFFSLRDRKYPTGLRTNRATGAGYWKATGKDREVYSSLSNGSLLGMKKTLVFYRGRAPRGEKTKWVMHEYRLEGDFSCRHTCKEEWVICRIFHKIGEKKCPTMHLQGHSYVSKQNPSFTPTITSPNSLPPLQESQSNQNPQNLTQNPFQFNPQESDLKSLINPLIISQNDLFSFNNFTHIATLSHQDPTLKELSNAIAKQCKKEPTTFSNYSIDDLVNNMNWAEKIGGNNAKYGSQLGLFGLEGRIGNNNNIGFTSHAMVDAVAIDHVMLKEPALKWW